MGVPPAGGGPRAGFRGWAGVVWRRGLVAIARGGPASQPGEEKGRGGELGEDGGPKRGKKGGADGRVLEGEGKGFG